MIFLVPQYSYFTCNDIYINITWENVVLLIFIGCTMRHRYNVVRYKPVSNTARQWPRGIIGQASNNTRPNGRAMQGLLWILQKCWPCYNGIMMYFELLFPFIDFSRSKGVTRESQLTIYCLGALWRIWVKAAGIQPRKIIILLLDFPHEIFRHYYQANGHKSSFWRHRWHLYQHKPSLGNIKDTLTLDLI